MIVAVIILLVLVIAGSLMIPAVTTGPIKSPLGRQMSVCTQLDNALDRFFLDSFIAGEMPTHLTISELVELNYIDDTFVKTLESDAGTYVFYLPVEGQDDSPSVRYFGPEGVVELTYRGSATFYDWDRWSSTKEEFTEQGAAANPYPLRGQG